MNIFVLMTWGDIIYLGRQWPGSQALYRPASLCCTRGAPCVCLLSSGGPCLHFMLPVSVLCPLEVHVPCVCLLSFAGPCLHLMFRVGSLSLPNYQLLPANFLYISVYFYFFLFFSVLSIFLCNFLFPQYCLPISW